MSLMTKLGIQRTANKEDGDKISEAIDAICPTSFDNSEIMLQQLYGWADDVSGRIDEAIAKGEGFDSTRFCHDFYTDLVVLAHLLNGHYNDLLVPKPTTRPGT